MLDLRIAAGDRPLTISMASVHAAADGSARPPACPKELQVDCGGGAIACRSACEAFAQDRYCCSGPYATPDACHPTVYSSIFKSACPRAYSYAYDDSTSTFTCKASDYTIAFCLPTSG